MNFIIFVLIASFLMVPITAYAENIELELSNPKVVDSLGNSVNEIFAPVNGVPFTYQASAILENNGTSEVNFTFYIMADDGNELLELNFFSASINPDQEFTLALTWNPQKEGNHTLIFGVWNNLGERNDLITPIELDVNVLSKDSPTESTKVASFVDPTKDPQSYIDRYNNEDSYKEWFDENYPDYTIEEAVGITKPIPGWIKNNADWWAEGLISEDEFVKGIEFLVSKGIIRVDNEIVPVKENKVTKVTNLEDIRPRPSSFGEWDRQRIVENTQAPENALDNIRMWYEKNGSLVQVYIFEFNTKSQANEYYSAYVNLADSTYYSANIDPISYTVSPSYSEEVCFDDQIVMPNGYPVGIRFSYVTGIVCESNNIVFHVYHQKDNLNEEDFDIYSAQQILTKINQKLGYEEPEVQITYLGSALPSNESYQVQDSGTSGDSFEIDVVSCEPTSGGHYIEVAYGIKNNLPDDYQLDLQILLLDNNGDVIEIKRTYADTKAGRTIYDDRLLDYDPRTVQCFIEIVDGFVPYN